MKKLALLLLAAVVFSGCSTTLQGPWQDFRAYYNTFYNAKQGFARGTETLERHGIPLHEPEWIRIYPLGKAAGQGDLRAAIEKSGSVLRKFPGSRWADDALFLRGRAYFYSDEPYPAMLDFEELYASADGISLRDEAVLWRGRVLYDLQRYREAAEYLRAHLDMLSVQENRNYRAEAKALLALQYCMLDSLPPARTLLGEATSELYGGELKVRTRYLQGQVLERLGAYEEAFYAYANVGQGSPEYDYVFSSEIKRAEMARRMGNPETSLEILNRLQRDDKSYDRRTLVRLEIARALEAHGSTARAERVYRELLRGRTRAADLDVRSRAYAGLGMIQSEQYGNHAAAAAYFDSAATGIRGTAEMTGGGDERLRQVPAYRRLSEIKLQIQRLDSLLWLGSLPSQERDSVIARVRERKLLSLKEEEQQRGERLLNTGPAARGNGSGSSAALFGFLNHRNEDLVRNARAQFRAYWGRRPLADNWRRREAVGEKHRNAEEPVAGTTGGGSEEDAPAGTDLNLEAIPVTEGEREQLRGDLAELHVELGNLYLLTLSRPDSAMKYYRRVIRLYPEAEAAGRALHGLQMIAGRQGTEGIREYR